MEMMEGTPRGAVLLDMSEPKTHEDTLARELEALKQHNYEMSAASGIIEVAGALKDIAPTAIWQGQVSIQKRLKTGELTDEDIKDGFELVNGFYVPTSVGAIMRCGDEREDENYDDNNLESYTSPLAPQLLGGDVAIANALWLYELIKNPGYQGDITEMFEDANRLIEELGYSTGVHGDTQKSKAGCGAAATKEGQLMIVSMADLGFRNLVGGYMGDEFNDNYVQQISEAVNRKVLGKNIRIPGPEELVDAALRFNPGGYAVKTGQHLGVGVVKNSVDGTTLHINHLNAATKGKLPFFNIDAWFDKKLAEAKSPHKDDQSLIKHIRATQTIATAMMLKDGSLHFGARRPKTA